MSKHRPEPKADPAFENLLEFLKQNRRFDFTGYKRSSLMRRIQARMFTVKVDNFTDYIDYLEVHPEEFPILFNTILINVTNFFRDPAAWEFLTDQILPTIVETKSPNDIIRCWSTGCASGQEAYTLAMLLAEKLGTEAFKERVKIYATDVDEEALNIARQGSFSAKEVENVPEPLLKKYFELSGTHYVFRNDFRRTIIFGRHDLVQDAPISRLDLLICRNTLMYFNVETQDKILNRLHFALSEKGYLFLGKAEMLLTRTRFFAPVDLKYRIFSKVPRSHLADPYLVPGRPNGSEAVTGQEVSPTLPEEVLDCLPIAQLTVDLNGILVLVNRQARALFNLKLEDLQRPLRDLEVSYRPVELRSLIDQVLSTRLPVKIADVEWKSPGDLKPVYLDIQIAPVFRPDNVLFGVSITFQDATRIHQLQQEISVTRHDLETTNEELHSSNEELETTNEELQSTVEELQTTNEELQATNEEMETMNEELQATNEELNTTNDELRQRTLALDTAIAFQRAILASLRSAVIALDRQFLITAWNKESEDLWGIRSAEAVGQSFFNLEIGLPVEELQPIVRGMLTEGSLSEERTIQAINRKGKPITCRAVATALRGSHKEIQGVILLIESLSEKSKKCNLSKE